MKYELKQGNNLVIELSTAAYELAKQCIKEVVNHEKFEFAYEMRDSIDQNGANVDTCIRIFNKKADGTCGRLLNFAINCYNTTSQILVNGNKVDLFITIILDKLCIQMKEKCDQLASVLNSAHQQTRPIKDKPHKLSDSPGTSYSENNPEDDQSENEVLELFPTCGS